MQNDELRGDQTELQEALERIVDLRDLAPTVATLLGVERKQLLGRPFSVERPDGTALTAHLVSNLHATGKEFGPGCG
jgi:hypothetical protein